eukprot:s317_g10.t1
MGSSVDASPEVAAPLQPPVPTGEMPAETTVTHASGAELEAVEAAKKEGESPISPIEKGKEESEEETEPAAKKAPVAEEEEYEVDAKAIKLCLEGCQRALDYVARQQLTISELQKQMIEIGSVMNHAESCQRYSIVRYSSRVRMSEMPPGS